MFIRSTTKAWSQKHICLILKKRDKINLHQGVLEVRDKHSEKEGPSKDKRKYLMRESSSSFYRRVALPANADEPKIKASFKDGVLSQPAIKRIEA